jgi:hypothetical protein
MNTDLVKFLNTAGPVYLLMIIAFALVLKIGTESPKKKVKKTK